MRIAPQLSDEQHGQLKEALRENGRRRTGHYRRACKRVSEDGILYQRFLNNAYDRYVRQQAAVGGEVGGPAEFFEWLLNWVIENQDSIMKFIMAIITLFTV